MQTLFNATLGTYELLVFIITVRLHSCCHDLQERRNVSIILHAQGLLLVVSSHSSGPVHRASTCSAVELRQVLGTAL